MINNIRKVIGSKNIVNRQIFRFCYKNNLDFLYNEHFLNYKLPHFKCLSGQIEILNDPIDYYIELHKGIRDSNERICMSALYLGTDNLEKYLVASINNKIKRSSKLKFTILMDYFRGSRINKHGESSIKMLSDLKTENHHNHNIKLAFFRNPTTSVLTHLHSESGFREIFGTHHMKINIFDNNILITGANLSENYFINRQDRYFLIKNCPDLANYLEELINVIVSNSYLVDDIGELVMANDQPASPQLKEFLKVFKQHFKLFTFSHKQNKKVLKEDFNKIFDFEEKASKTIVTKDIKNKEEDIIEDKKTNKTEEKNEIKTDENFKNEMIPKYFQENSLFLKTLDEKKQAAKLLLQRNFGEGDVGNIIRKLETTLFRVKTEEKGELLDLGGNVFIFPVIQIPCLNHTEDESLLAKLIEFQAKSSKNLIRFASGYMNIGKKLSDLISNSHAKIDLLTASPKANGFYNGGFFKGIIPFLYRVYEMKLMKNLERHQNKNVNIFEYFRGEWTFHTKGIWFYENQEETPSLTIIGSSNYSQRSYKRDNEIQFYIYSVCPKFKERLQKENVKQFQNAQKISLNEIKSDEEIKLKWRHQIAFTILKSFL